MVCPVKRENFIIIYILAQRSVQTTFREAHYFSGTGAASNRRVTPLLCLGDVLILLYRIDLRSERGNFELRMIQDRKSSANPVCTRS